MYEYAQQLVIGLRKTSLGLFPRILSISIGGGGGVSRQIRKFMFLFSSNMICLLDLKEFIIKIYKKRNVTNCSGKRPLERPKYRWEGNIRLNLKKWVSMRGI